MQSLDESSGPSPMARAELSLSAPAGGNGMPDIAAAAKTSRTAKPPTEEQVNAKREALHAAAFAAVQSGKQTDAVDEVAPPKPREDIESVEIEIPGGKVVHFGPPGGVALQLRIASLLGQNLNEYTAGIVKTVMSIRSIDGVPVPAVGNLVDVQRVSNMVGEDGLDVLMLASASLWPAITVADLRIVKKNLR